MTLGSAASTLVRSIRFGARPEKGLRYIWHKVCYLFTKISILNHINSDQMQKGYGHNFSRVKLSLICSSLLHYFSVSRTR